MENHGTATVGARTKLVEGLTTFGVNFFGVALMITPLALWVAWTETVLYIVLAAGFMAATLYCLLYLYEQRADLRMSASATSCPAESVPDEFVAELHDLFPLTYHHRRLGDPAFQRKMDRLKRLLAR